MKVSDLRNMTTEELKAKGRDLTQELFNLRFQLHTGRLENTAKLVTIRKDIARVETIIKEKQG